LKDAVVSAIVGAVGNWLLKADLQEPCSAEYKNRVALTTKDAVTVMVCFTTLKDEVVNQIIDASNFEEGKARTIEIVWRNEARGTQLTSIVEKGQAEDGEVDGGPLEKCHDNPERHPPRPRICGQREALACSRCF
jgi:hypothetical protein